MKGILYLIPTPIDTESNLHQDALELLKCAPEGSRFVVEDARPGRRKWLHYGLPREEIDRFICYNEQTHEEARAEIMNELSKGINVYMMSDAGLPAFCDPGRALVEECHRKKIKVKFSTFENSTLLALAMSGFSHQQFVFQGFPPKKGPDRPMFWDKVISEKRTSIVMDTSYRLKKIIDEIIEAEKRNKISRTYFLARDLNKESEEYSIGDIRKISKDLDIGQKKEFVLVIREGR